MSAVTSSRYRVSFFDGDDYDIIVEAVSEAAAIKKARRATKTRSGNYAKNTRKMSRRRRSAM